MIKSPKEKFQASQVKTSNWAAIAANPMFDEVCDIAMLQLLWTMPQDDRSHLQIIGAQHLLKILKTIHEAPEKETYQQTKGLNYQAGV